MGSAALTAAVPYPGTVTPLTHNGQRSTIKKKLKSEKEKKKKSRTFSCSHVTPLNRVIVPALVRNVPCFVSSLSNVTRPTAESKRLSMVLSVVGVSVSEASAFFLR